jgi:hypothetical protein
MCSDDPPPSRSASSLPKTPPNRTKRVARVSTLPSKTSPYPGLNKKEMARVEGAPAHGAVAHLLPQTYKRFVSEWLEEDTPSFDYGGFVVGEEMSEAKLLGKSEVRAGFFPLFLAIDVNVLLTSK